jgi:hypothetical protein
LKTKNNELQGQIKVLEMELKKANSAKTVVETKTQSPSLSQQSPKDVPTKESATKPIGLKKIKKSRIKATSANHGMGTRLSPLRGFLPCSTAADVSEYRKKKSKKFHSPLSSASKGSPNDQQRHSGSRISPRTLAKIKALVASPDTTQAVQSVNHKRVDKTSLDLEDSPPVNRCSAPKKSKHRDVEYCQPNIVDRLLNTIESGQQETRRILAINSINQNLGLLNQLANGK